MKNQPIQISADASFCWFYNRFLMILRVERCDDVFMKNMKILILHRFFKDLGEKSTRSKFGGWVILLVLQWVFNDFTY